MVASPLWCVLMVLGLDGLRGSGRAVGNDFESAAAVGGDRGERHGAQRPGAVLERRTTSSVGSVTWIGVARSAVGSVDQLDEHAHRLVAERLDRLVDRGQRRIGERGLGDVVEARRPTGRRGPGCRARPRCGSSGSPTGRWRRRSRVGRSASASNVAGRRLGRLLGEPADLDEVGVERDAGRVERGAVAGLAAPRRLEIGPAGEEADPAVAELDEMLGGGDGALEVLGRRRSGGPTRRRAGRRRRPDAIESTSTTVGVTRIVPSASVPLEPRQVAALPALVAAACPPRVDDQVEVGVAQRVGGALEQLGAERLDVGRRGCRSRWCAGCAGCGRRGWTRSPSSSMTSAHPGRWSRWRRRSGR